MMILTAWTAFACAGSALAQAASAGEPAQNPTAEQVGKGVMHGLTANLFRLNAAVNVEAAVQKWGSDAFKAKWKQEVGAVFDAKENIELQDFFTSAVVWVGGMREMRSVVALYSPWADALLVLALEIEPGDPTKASLSDFAFMSGESLRGVAQIRPEEALALYQLKEPLKVAVARLYAPSVETFTRLYPPSGVPVLVPEALKARLDSQVGELIVIKARLIVRMKMFQDYLDKENHGWLVESGVLIRALKAGDQAILLSFLSEQQSPAIVETICSLDPKIRGDFGPAYFSKAKDSVIMGFVNPSAPRWLIEATFLGEKPGKRSARIELMDLEASATALKLWGKEAPK